MASKIERLSTRLHPVTQMFHLQPSVKFGPDLPDGRQQRVRSGGAHWIAELGFQLTTADEIREFRSAVIRMNGGATEVMVPARDRRQAPWPTGFDYTSIQDELSWDDSRTFTTSFATQIIKVQAYGAHIAGATEIEIRAFEASPLRRGQMFSITDKTGRARLYTIVQPPSKPIYGPPGPATVFRQTIQIQPPLRAKVAHGAVLEFDQPFCTMTLDRPDAGAMTFEGWYKAAPSLTFRESFGGT